MKYRVLALILSCIFVSALSVHAQDKAVWQTSSDLKVHLDLRSKFAANAYTVKFLVIGPKYEDGIIKKVKGNEFVTAIFPDDFHAEVTDGTYKWQAIVGGKPVLSGWFTYKNVGTPDKFGWQNRQVTLHVDSK